MAQGYSSLHPSATAGRGRRIGLTNLYRCKQCGFPVDTSKRTRKGSESVLDGIQITITDSSTIDVQAVSGCPQCGTFNWSDRAPTVPKKRPDERPRFLVRRRYPKRYERF